MWSIPPSRILVPVDFSEASGRAVGVAAALASRVGARLQVLHVEALEVPAYFTREQTQALERERAIARSRADAFLGDFARSHGATTFTTQITEGLPTPTILDAAAGVDLVVMGTHGRRGPARWWLGSVAERVVHDAPVPVLVVRGDAREDALDVLRRPIVFSGESANRPEAEEAAGRLAEAVGGHVVEQAAACAADLAAAHQASVVVVSAVGRHGAWLAHPAEQWLRSCPLPMLFVPAALGR